jgi:hypothetical protein
MPPSTVYKGDLTEISFGHETGFVLTDNYAGSFNFQVITVAGENTSILRLTGGAASTPINGGILKVPKGMLVGVKISIIGGTNFAADDNQLTGKMFTVVGHLPDEANTRTDITVTPALSTATSTNAGASDSLVFHSFGLPSLDVNMAHDDMAHDSSESSLTDQFLGITTAITLPETRVDLKRYHVVGLGRDVAVQVSGRFINEGGSFEVNMHNPRWLYYCLGMEAIDVDSAGATGGQFDTLLDVEATGVLLNESTITADSDAVLTVDTVDATTKFNVGDAVYDDAGAFTGLVKTVDSSTQITLEANNITEIANNENLGRIAVRLNGAVSAGVTTLTIDGTAPDFLGGSDPVAVGDYVIIKDTTVIDISSVKEGDQTAFGAVANPKSTYFDRTETNEIRRIVGINATKIWLDDALCFAHADNTPLRFARFNSGSTQGSPDRASTGVLTNGVTRLLYSRSHVPSFALEVSIRRRDNQTDDGTDDEVIDGGTTDAKQLTRVFRGCKVKEFSLTADTDAALRLNVGFDSALCYTDTGRLETQVNGFSSDQEEARGDRYNVHRIFEDTANTDKARKEAGIAVGTQKPYMFYNGTITLAGVQIGQVVSFTVTGSTGVQQFYTINGAPINDNAADQVPFAGARNASIAVEGQTEYMMDMEIIVDDPIFYHKMRRAVDHDATTANMIRLSFTKVGSAGTRESLDIYLDDYVITEAPLPIPEDKGPIRVPLKVMPKAMRVISTDTLFHC